MAAEAEDFSLLLFNTISQPPLQEFHRPHKTRNLRLITKFKSFSQYYITIKGPAIQLSPSQLALHKVSSHLIPQIHKDCLPGQQQSTFIYLFCEVWRWWWWCCCCCWWRCGWRRGRTWYESILNRRQRWASSKKLTRSTGQRDSNRISFPSTPFWDRLQHHLYRQKPFSSSTHTRVYI